MSTCNDLRLRWMAPVALACLLAACGGGGSTATTAPGNNNANANSDTTAVNASFPSGLAVAAPTDVSSGGATAQAAPWDGLRFAADWGRAAWQALREGDMPRLGRLAAAALPMGAAQAGGEGDRSEIKTSSDELDKVLHRESSVTLSAALKLRHLFSVLGTNASCYGPQVLYANHDDQSGASGQLPGGDLGLWLETDSDGTTPCVAAQMTKKLQGVRRQTRQGLLLMATLRRVVAASSTVSMPTAGNTTDLTSTLNTALSGAGLDAEDGVTISAASITLSSDGATYTYRVVATRGSGDEARTGEVILRHVPGSDATHYQGVMQVAGFTLSNDAAFGCTDQMNGANYKVAAVSTLRYTRSGTAVAFSSRSGQYCGHGTSTTDLASDVASFDGQRELDAAIKISGNTAGGTKGWRGNFTRFAGDFSRDTLDGDFLLAWQAGPGDSHTRVLAATSLLNSVSGDRTVNGYFAYGREISASTGAVMAGMICNWAGPGGSHATNPTFQSQSAVLVSGASGFTTSGTSHITYAPTNSCNSSGSMTFDVNANGTIGTGEGANTTNNLDGLAGSNTTVMQELTSRSFGTPTLF